jgi:hypothetical protein
VFYAEPPFYFNTAVNLSSYIFSKSHSTFYREK